MDGGSYRSGDRRVINRAGSQEPAPRQQEQPQPVADEPRVAHRVPASYRDEKEPKKSNRLILWIAAAVVIILLAVGGWWAWSASHTQNGATAIDSSKYQAVFFTNGQVYFGKLQAFNSDYLKLTDIFYLQTQSSDSNSSNPQKTTSDQNSNVQLIKLGDEIHGPEDEMILSKQQVLFYENLKSDGKVAQSIEKYKQANK